MTALAARAGLPRPPLVHDVPLACAGLLLLVLVVGLPLLAAGTAWPVVAALALTVVPTLVTLLQLALSRARETTRTLRPPA